MSLKSSNQVATNRYQLEIEVDGDTFEKAVDHAYKKQKNRINIPGFRKGKAPRSFIEKYYGANVFYEDAINEVYPSALEEAVKAANLEMIEDKIDFDLVSAEKEGLVFKATITTKPEVTIENYKGIEAKKPPVTVTEDDIVAELKKIQERNARMVTVEDRAAQNGDIAEIDFEGFVDGKAFEGGKAENYSLNLGAGQFIPGFEDQVVGHKANDEFDITVTFPEDYQEESLKGKEAVFKVKVHEVKKEELPELDDDFAKDVSDFDTLDEYKKDVEKKLTESRENAAKDDVDNQLIDKMVELLQGEIPAAMFENRINEDINEFAYRLQSQGLNLESYMKYTGMDKKAMRENMRPQAERQVKLRLALEKIAELENVKPTEEDLSKEYQKLAEGYHLDVDKVKKAIPAEDLSKDLKAGKAMDFVRDNAIVTEGEDSKSAEKSKEKTAKSSKAKTTKEKSEKKESETSAE